MIESMPVVHCHLPNHVVFGDKIIVRDENDVGYTASELRDLLVNQSRIKGDAIKVLDRCNEQLKIAPKPPGVPTYMIFNSAMETSLKEWFKKGFQKDPVRETVSGDGTVLAKGPKWAAYNWPASGTFIAVDVYRDSPDYSHMSLVSNSYLILSSSGE